MALHGTGAITRILLQLSCGRSHQGKRTDQQRFYDHLDIAFLVLGYVRRGALITKSERQHKSERDYTITLPNHVSNLVPLLLTGSFPGFEPKPLAT